MVLVDLGKTEGKDQLLIHVVLRRSLLSFNVYVFSHSGVTRGAAPGDTIQAVTAPQ